MIRPAVLAGLSVLLAAWSAEGATVYRRGGVRPAGAMAVLGGPAAKPAAVIGGPAEPKARLPGLGASRTPSGSKFHRRNAAGLGGPTPAAPSPAAAEFKSPRVAAPAARFERSEPKGKSDDRSARR